MGPSEGAPDRPPACSPRSPSRAAATSPSSEDLRPSRRHLPGGRAGVSRRDGRRAARQGGEARHTGEEDGVAHAEAPSTIGPGPTAVACPSCPSRLLASSRSRLDDPALATATRSPAKYRLIRLRPAGRATRRRRHERQAGPAGPAFFAFAAFRAARPKSLAMAPAVERCEPGNRRENDCPMRTFPLPAGVPSFSITLASSRAA